MIGWTLDPTPGRKDYVDLCCSIKSFPCLLNAPCQCLTEFAISLVSGCAAGRLLQVYRETVEVSGLYPKMFLISLRLQEEIIALVLRDCHGWLRIHYCPILIPYGETPLAWRLSRMSQQRTFCTSWLSPAAGPLLLFIFPSQPPVLSIVTEKIRFSNNRHDGRNRIVCPSNARLGPPPPRLAVFTCHNHLGSFRLHHSWQIF
jgi:hypothetical protein